MSIGFSRGIPFNTYRAGRGVKMKKLAVLLAFVLAVAIGGIAVAQEGKPEAKPEQKGDEYRRDKEFYGNPLKDSGANKEVPVPEAEKEVEMSMVGVVLLKEKKLRFVPLFQHHMAVERWRLDGKTKKLVEQLEEGKRYYCKLKGKRVFEKHLEPGPRQDTCGDHVREYRLVISEVCWVKTPEEVKELDKKKSAAKKDVVSAISEGRYKDAMEKFRKLKELDSLWPDHPLVASGWHVSQFKRLEYTIETLLKLQDEFKPGKEHVEFLFDKVTRLQRCGKYYSNEGAVRKEVDRHLDSLEKEEAVMMEATLVKFGQSNLLAHMSLFYAVDCLVRIGSDEEAYKLFKEAWEKHYCRFGNPGFRKKCEKKLEELKALAEKERKQAQEKKEK
jgi:hypothetical protein